MKKFLHCWFTVKHFKNTFIYSFWMLKDQIRVWALGRFLRLWRVAQLRQTHKNRTSERAKEKQCEIAPPSTVGSDGDIHGLTARQCSQCVCGAWYHFFRSCVLLSCFKQHNFFVDQQYTYVLKYISDCVTFFFLFHALTAHPAHATGPSVFIFYNIFVQYSQRDLPPSDWWRPRAEIRSR